MRFFSLAANRSLSGRFAQSTRMTRNPSTGHLQFRRATNRVRAWRFAALCCVFTLVCAVAGTIHAADTDDPIIAEIDRLIQRGWADNSVTPSERAIDGEFARRASLDIVGHIPSLEMLTDFLEDESPDKRRRFVDRLLEETGYAKNWSTIWANLLVGRGNNRTGNRPALEKWLRDSLYRNEAYNKIVFELISATGETNENGAVNFLSSHLNDGALPATAITARVFLGMQVQCTQCHNHPFNDWKQSQFWGLNAFFRGTRVQRFGTNNRQFILDDGPAAAMVFFERRNGLQEAIARQFIDGTLIEIPENEDDHPRLQLAKLITDPERPYLAETQINRMWGHFFGYGFTKPVDDMGPHNQPSNPELVKYLASQFTKSGFDLKRLIRWITASEAYQLTSQAGSGNKLDDPAAGSSALFSRMYAKQFTAEQLYDSLIIATDAHKANRDDAAAETQRQAWLGQFIRTFGTDENDETTTFNGTIPQALVMMNGDLISSATSPARGSFLQRLLDEDPRKSGPARKSLEGARPRTPAKAESTSAKKKSGASRSVKASPRLQKTIDTLFLATLARTPSDDELQRVNAVFQQGSREPIAALQDLFWALLNSNEFIINH